MRTLHRITTASSTRAVSRICLLLLVLTAGIVGSSTALASSVRITASDMVATSAWYRDNLRFRLLAERSYTSGRIAVLERRGLLLEIAEDTGRERPVLLPDAPAVAVVVPDVDQETEALAEKGVRVILQPEDDSQGRYRFSWVQDNEGRTVELREPLTSAGLGRSSLTRPSHGP